MTPLQAVLYSLITLFVERQRVPFEVIQKYRAYLVDPAERRSHDKAYLSATHMGFWGEANEWEYRLHGGGCHVRQLMTGEVIGWNAPNLQRFDPYWLVDWVRWYVQQHGQDNAVLLLVPLVGQSEEACRQSLFEMLEQLHKIGKLTFYPDSTNKYELVTEDS
jgi:hypothetical protein